MKPRTATALVLFAIYQIASQGPALSAPIDAIRDANAAVANRSRTLEEAVDVAAQHLAKLPASDSTSALYSCLKLPRSEQMHWDIVFRIVERLPNFDMNEWVLRLGREDDPFVTDYAIKIASSSQKADSELLLAFLHRSLSDKRVGRKLTGEARAYAKEGLRICDDVLNILWDREPAASQPPGFPFGVSNSSPEQLDRLIAEYARRFNVPLTATDPANTKSTSNSAPGSAHASPLPKVSEPKPMPR